MLCTARLVSIICKPDAKIYCIWIKGNNKNSLFYTVFYLLIYTAQKLLLTLCIVYT